MPQDARSALRAESQDAQGQVSSQSIGNGLFTIISIVYLALGVNSQQMNEDVLMNWARRVEKSSKVPDAGSFESGNV